MKLDSIDDEIIINIGSKVFILTKGPNESLVITPQEGHNLTSRRGGAFCTRIQHKIILESD